MSGFYKTETIQKFNKALVKARATKKPVCISRGNIKMGAIPSVSLLPYLTCPSSCKETCGGKCYAAKIANLRPSVLESYAKNTAAAMFSRDEYFKTVNSQMRISRLFRYHVSGDILDRDYFNRMVDSADQNPHCQILVFTKRYGVVNEWINENGKLPDNLHVLFSGWSNLTPDNPHNLPETNVILKGQDAKPNWKICGGNCMECSINGFGCWSSKNGETIAFPEH